MHILLIDNNDSFTRNLEHLLVAAIRGGQVRVAPYGELDSLDLTWPELIVISPGPGSPAEYPGYARVLAADRPVLGICLGMQIINEYCGGSTDQLSDCVHGKTDEISWQNETRTVARYHSLQASSVGEGLSVLASNPQGVTMCLGSREKRLFGYQFHPESFLTPQGERFIHDALMYLGCR